MAQREVWQKPVTDTEGNILVGASVTVFEQDGSTLATIYSNLQGGFKDNPFLTSADGLARFYADPGRYVVRAQKGSFLAENIDVDLSMKALRSDLSDGSADIAGESAKDVAISTRRNVTPEMLEIEPSKTSPTQIYDAIVSGVDFAIPKPIRSFSDACSQWSAGNKFPIAIFGDSTTDGRVSTTNGVDEMTEYNSNFLVSGNVPDGFNRDHDETTAPNAYVSVLQRLAREHYKFNNVLRVYNAGWRGRQIQDGWATSNIHNAVYANPAYADCKMIGINFGINDSDRVDNEVLRSRTYQYTKALILDAYMRGVQPFLMTTNAMVELSDAGGNYGHNEEIVAIIDEVKYALAREFGIEIVAMGEFMYDFIYANKEGFSSDYLLPDGFHSNDVLHLKQAEYFLYSHLSAGLIVKAKDGLLVDGMHPAAKFPLSKGWFAQAQFANTYASGGAVKARTLIVTDAFVSADALEQDLFDVWVWSDGDQEAYIDMSFITGGSRVRPESAASTDSLPQILVEGYFGSDPSYLKTNFDDHCPGYIGNHQSSGIWSAGIGAQHYKLCRLNTGLSRSRIYFKLGAAADFNNWSGTLGAPIGYLRFDKVSNENKALSLTRNYTGSAATPWQSAIESPINYDAYQVDTYTFTENVTSPEVKRSYSLNKVGQKLEVTFKMPANLPDWSGVILCHGVAWSASQSPTIPNDKVNLLTSWSLAIYRRELDELRLGLTYQSGFVFGAAITDGVNDGVYSDIEGELCKAVIEITSITAGKVSIFKGSELIGELAINGAQVTLLQAGYIGGAWNAYGNNANSSFYVEPISYRVIR